MRDELCGADGDIVLKGSMARDDFATLGIAGVVMVIKRFEFGVNIQGDRGDEFLQPEKWRWAAQGFRVVHSSWEHISRAESRYQ